MSVACLGRADRHSDVTGDGGLLSGVRKPGRLLTLGENSNSVAGELGVNDATAGDCDEDVLDRCRDLWSSAERSLDIGGDESEPLRSAGGP